MMLVALLMRPWIVMMIENDGGAQRVRGCIIVKGRAMIGKRAKALELTHVNCRDVGATLAFAKSFNLPQQPRQ